MDQAETDMFDDVRVVGFRGRRQTACSPLTISPDPDPLAARDTRSCVGEPSL